MINQIIEVLIAAIKRGEYDDNRTLPSEHNLAERFNVSRHTVRQVYHRLEEMGYINTSPGIGRTARRNETLIELQLKGSISFTEKIVALGMALNTTFISVQDLPSNDERYAPLRTSDSDTIIELTRLRVIDSQPAAIHSSYVSAQRFPNIVADSGDLTSLFAYYRQRGYDDFYYKNSVLHTELPTQSVRHQLACPSLNPVLILTNECYDGKSDQLIEYSQIVYRGDRFYCRLSDD